MSHIQRPLTIATYPELLRKINEMSIGIKLHHIIEPDKNVLEARINHDLPTWEDVIFLLNECRNAINEIREDPRKY